MMLSKHLSLKEVTKSNTATRLGISNNPTKLHLENLKLIAEEIFEPLRNWAGCPIGISSGYRSEALNKAIGSSSKTSQHCKGQALDIDADIYGGITNAEIFHFIKNNLDYTQLIVEFPKDGNPSWIHVGYDVGNLKNQILIALKENGKTKYIPYKGNENLVSL